MYMASVGGWHRAGQHGTGHDSTWVPLLFWIGTEVRARPVSGTADDNTITRKYVCKAFYTLLYARLPCCASPRLGYEGREH